MILLQDFAGDFDSDFQHVGNCIRHLGRMPGRGELLGRGVGVEAKHKCFGGCGHGLGAAHDSINLRVVLLQGLGNLRPTGAQGLQVGVVG